MDSIRLRHWKPLLFPEKLLLESGSSSEPAFFN
jgi:hypothetical protein